MKRATLIAAGAIAAAALAFLLGAFMGWDINPGHWTRFGRFMTGCLIVFSAFAAAVSVVVVTGEEVS